MIRTAGVALFLILCAPLAKAAGQGLWPLTAHSQLVPVQSLRFDNVRPGLVTPAPGQGGRGGGSADGLRSPPPRIVLPNHNRAVSRVADQTAPSHSRRASALANNAPSHNRIVSRRGENAGGGPSHSRRASAVAEQSPQHDKRRSEPQHRRRISALADSAGRHRRWISARDQAWTASHARRTSDRETAGDRCAAGTVWRHGRCHRRAESVAVIVRPKHVPRPPVIVETPARPPSKAADTRPGAPPRRPPRTPGQPPAQLTAPVPAVAALLDQGPHRPREIIVAISAEPDARAGLMSDYNLQAGPVREIALTGVRILRLSLLDNRPLGNVITQLQADPRVVSVQPNYVYGLDGGPPAALREAQYNLDAIKATAAHRVASGRNVRVAVIDTCIDGAHPDLGNAVAGSFDALGGKPSPCRGAEYHGTAVAGVIAARASLQGVAPGVDVLSARAFGAGGSAAVEGTTETLLMAFDWAIAEKAQILNLSFTGPRDPLVEAGVAAAIERGALLVAAVGNKGPDSPPLYPAAYPGVIAVSATDARNAAYPMGNTGPHVAIAAPGVDVLTLRPDEAYDFGSGTSYAAAHISGVLALIMERNPGFTPDEAVAALLGSASDLGAQGRDDIFGAGLADAEQAVAGSTPARKASAARQ